eukprot:9897503-Lingulodinium_polyedra.AAC.1
MVSALLHSWKLVDFLGHCSKSSQMMIVPINLQPPSNSFHHNSAAHWIRWCYLRLLTADTNFTKYGTLSSTNFTRAWLEPGFHICADCEE